VRQVRIDLDPQRLRANQITPADVSAALARANSDVPVGLLYGATSEAIVRVEGKVRDAKAFGDIVVSTRGGSVVRLADLGRLSERAREADSLARVDGRPAINFQVFKQQDANIVETGEGVKAAAEELRKSLPPGVELKLVYADSDWVRNSLAGVKRTLIEGALLTIAIVFLFLHSWRSTIITGLTLPIAVVSSFIAVHAFGFTLNFMTMMALSLTIGLLIDDAIVVRENIVRHVAMGKDHVRAAREGTEEIGLAVMATTFAIVAVFVPIAFMSGVIGRFFFQFGIAVAVAVLVSLFISFTLDPMLSSLWPDPPETRFSKAPWLGRIMDRVEHFIDWVHRLYDDVLAWALSHRKSVLAIALVTFLARFAIVPLVGTEFIPEADEGLLSLRLNTPVGSSLEYTNGKVAEAEETLKRFPEIALAMTTIGTEDGRNYARINLKLVPAAERKRSQKQLERAIRAALKPIPGVQLSVGFNYPIWFNLLGPDPETLTKLSAEFESKVAKIPGIADLETSEKAANPALSIRLNNDAAADLGITVQQVGATIRPLVAGDTISYWLGPDGQNYEVNVQVSPDRRQLASDLGNLYLTTNKRGPDGQMRMVPLRQVADLVESTSPQIIKRQDLQRRVGIYANVEGRPAGDVGSDVQKVADQMTLPPGYRLAAAGQQQDMQESFQAAVAALGLAVIFIYLILASQFASFTQPVAIMASLPFSLIGVFLALLVTGTTLNIFSIIGFIMLMGLVTKNAILLVDFANRSRRAGAPLSEAVRTAGQVRLRPILMTTAAMIGGMLPLALGLGDGGEQQAPMGRAIIGGVVTSTLLTLVVVPVIYTYLDGWSERRKARRAARHAAAAPTPLPQAGDD
jgi:multidrug efflux pump subunit AcrB